MTGGRIVSQVSQKVIFFFQRNVSTLSVIDYILRRVIENTNSKFIFQTDQSMLLKMRLTMLVCVLIQGVAPILLAPLTQVRVELFGFCKIL